MEEDWGAAVVNTDEVEETLGLALATTPSSSQPSELSSANLKILPNAIAVDGFADVL